MSHRIFLQVVLAVVVTLSPFAQLWSVQQRVLAQAIDLNRQLDFTFRTPGTAEEARDTFPDRANRVIDYLACGNEVGFADFARTANEHGEEITAYLIAKVYRYYQLIGYYGFLPQASATCGSMLEVQGNSENVAAELQAHGLLGNPESCTGVTVSQLPDFKSRIEFSVTAACLKQQVNAALMSLQFTNQPGSTVNVCLNNIITLNWGEILEVEGEYDVRLRNLLRILYMRPTVLYEPRNSDILDRETYDHVVSDLLVLDKGDRRDSYSLEECGYTDTSTGTPQERADRESTNNEIVNAIDSVARVSESLFRKVMNFFLFLVLISFVGLIVSALSILGIPAIVSLGVGIGAAIAELGPGVLLLPYTFIPGLDEAEFFRFPETENHLLMMETSRYLTNQLIVDNLEATNYHEIPVEFQNDRNGVRDWLLGQMQSVLQHDFIEYNAKPYQRYSLNAVLNLADFALSANDPQMQQAAQMVLDYVSAKYALGSSQARRDVPFRRLEEFVPQEDLFNMGSGADHLMARMLLLTGITDRLPNNGWLDQNAALEMIYAAVSRYRLPIDVLDLALDQSSPYFERIHHGNEGGVEIFARGDSYLLTAGGVATDSPYSLAGTSFSKDEGFAVATTLIATVHGNRRSEFLRFGAAAPYPDNTCVYSGFACGLDPVVPALYEMCDYQRASQPGWTFFNSARCTFGEGISLGGNNAGNHGPYFYAALYQERCPDDYGSCTEGNQMGVLEVQDAAQAAHTLVPNEPPQVDEAAFLAFVDAVLAANPSVYARDADGNLMGTYHTQAGDEIRFEPSGGNDDPDEWAIREINGNPTQQILEDWPLATGSILDAHGDGRVVFTNPNRNTSFTLDLTNRNQPIPPVIMR